MTARPDSAERVPTGDTLAPGSVIDGRYRVLRVLGVGGMGSVYEAEHVLVRRRVAMKVLRREMAEDSSAARRFHREALASSAIGHPNIVDVHDMGELSDGSPYMVLELLRGRDWRHDIKATGPQPLGRVARIVCQLAEALSAAHAVGIVHRDLKPDNVFLSPQAHDPLFVKVLDFGISKFRTPILDQATQLTRTGTMMGTPFFMPPEQLHAERDIDARADVYALGVSAFYALGARLPFEADSVATLMVKVLTQEPESLAIHRPELPAPVVDVIRAMLAKAREDRPPRMEEIRDAFAPFCDGEVGPAVPIEELSAPVQDLGLAPTMASELAVGAVGPQQPTAPAGRVITSRAEASEASPLLPAGDAASASPVVVPPEEPKRSPDPRWVLAALVALALVGAVAAWLGGRLGAEMEQRSANGSPEERATEIDTVAAMPITAPPEPAPPVVEPDPVEEVAEPSARLGSRSVARRRAAERRSTAEPRSARPVSAAPSDDEMGERGAPVDERAPSSTAEPEDPARTPSGLRRIRIPLGGSP